MTARKSKKSTNHIKKHIPAANQVINSTLSVTSKVADPAINCLTPNHKCNSHHYSLMGNQQTIGYCIASIKLGNRRVQRMIKNHDKLVATGLNISMLSITFGWLIDHLLYLWDLIWGLIYPILIHLAIGLVQIFAVIVCNVIFFGVLYWFLAK